MSVYSRSHGPVHVLTMDDGDSNIVNIEVVHQLLDALRTAQDEAQALVIAGRDGYYSAGLDKKIFAGGGAPASDLLHGATELILRLVEFPRPVVTACTGPALGAAAICLLACDYRVGAVGDYEIGMNYVAFGMEVPDLAITLARSRLSARHMTRACLTAKMYSPAEAVEAGFLDVVTPEDPVEKACETAARYAETLNMAAFEETRKMTCRTFTDTIIRSAGDLWRMQRPRPPPPLSHRR